MYNGFGLEMCLRGKEQNMTCIDKINYSGGVPTPVITGGGGGGGGGGGIKGYVLQHPCIMQHP